MVTLVALVVWGLPLLLVLPLYLIFALLDGVYLSSALTKVPEGAWFTLALALLLSSIFILWRFGKENQWRAEYSDRIPLSHLLTEVRDINEAEEEPELRLSLELGSGPITRLKGIGIFFDKSGIPPYAPTVFLHFLQKFQAVPRVVVFFTFRPLSTPTVPAEDRFSVSHCSVGTPGSGTPTAPLRNFYRVVVRHGYMDEKIITPELGPRIYDAVRAFIVRTSVAPSPPPSATPDGSSTSNARSSAFEALKARRLTHLATASEDQILNIIGKEQLRINEGKCCSGFWRKVFLAGFLWLRAQTGTRVKNMELEVEKVVEVGFVKAM